MSDPRGLRSTRRKTLGSRLEFLSILSGFRNRFSKCLPFCDGNVFFVMRVCRSRFLMISGSVLDVWGYSIKHLVRDVLQKTSFGALDTGLKFDDFRGLTGGARS